MKEVEQFYKFNIPNDWEIKSLGDLGEILSGLTYSPSNISETGTLVLRSSNVQQRVLSFKDNVYVDIELDKYNSVKKDDILICVRNGSKSLIGKNALITSEAENFAFGAFMSVFRSEYNNYLYHLLDTDFYRREIHRNLGATINSINGNNLKKFKFPFPPPEEQKAIANILSNMDTAINANNKLIDQKELYRKGLQQNLLNGTNRVQECIKNKKLHKTKLGTLPIDWQILPIKEVLVSAGESLTPKKEELYQQIGIRSHKKGIFYKEKVTGTSLGNKRVFWIEPDCFIVNIVFAWEHAIAKTTDNEVGMIASHRFPMYKPKEGVLDLDYLLYFFKSPRGKHLLGLASPGGAGRNKTLGKLEFMKLRIPVPPIEEQKGIAKILLVVDKEIELLKAKIEKLKEQKKGMMQVLLTGKKRLKI